MISNIEGPYEDEALISLLARTARPLIRTSRSAFARFVFGQRDFAASLDFPFGIDRFVSAIGHRVGLDAETTIRRHTIYPFVAPFMSEERAALLREGMRGMSHGAVNMVRLHQLPDGNDRRRLKFCARCRAKDIRRFGHTYWRRVHQIPGVTCCAEHFTPLELSQFAVGSVWKIDYPLADDAVSTGREVAPDQIDCEFAEDAKWLLSNDADFIDRGLLRELYQRRLEQLELVLPNGHIQRAEFLRRFFARRDEHRWELRHLCFRPDQWSSWPAATIKLKSNHRSGQMHLMVMRFLGIKLARLRAELDDVQKTRRIPGAPTDGDIINHLRQTWNDPGITLNAIMRALGVGRVKLFSRAIQAGLPVPRFSTEGSTKSVSELQRQYARDLESGRFPKYSHEWRWRRQWLCLHAPEWKPALRPKKGRVDWLARENDLLTRLSRAEAVIRAERPFRQVSIRALISQLPQGHNLWARLAKMPRLKKEMDRRAETHEEFALRKVQVIRQLEPQLPAYRVREKACVRLNRSPRVMEALGYRLVGKKWVTRPCSSHPRYGLSTNLVVGVAC